MLVALLAERAEVRFNSAVITVKEIADAIEDMGFEADILDEADCIEGEITLIVGYHGSPLNLWAPFSTQ